MEILHINTFDAYGGAEQVAISLLDRCSTSSLFVKEKFSSHPRVFQLKGNKTFFEKAFIKVAKKELRTYFGIRDSFHNTTSRLEKLDSFQSCKIVHLHNIHGGFFDINSLPQICQKKKIVWTLHDMWCMTGGEAHTFGNENFKKGIGYTPYKIYYPLNNPLIDLRGYYLKKKREIYTTCKRNLVFVPVSKWLEKQLRDSFVYNSNMLIRTIYNGINTSTFRNLKQRTWNVPRILFFNSESPFKGSQLFINILNTINAKVELWVVGNDVSCNNRNVEIKKIEKVTDRELLNRLYNQVDILVFPSIAENFPLTTLEAMASGVCVIASNVGGIPEQVDDEVGYLFEPENKNYFSELVNRSIYNLSETRRKGELANEKVCHTFSMEKMFDEYRGLYKEL